MSLDLAQGGSELPHEMPAQVQGEDGVMQARADNTGGVKGLIQGV